jgi:uncharacterized protein (DUF433 family)
MLCEVILTQQNDTYIARAKDWPEVVVEEQTRDAAIEQIKTRLADYLTNPTVHRARQEVEVIQVEIPLPAESRRPPPDTAPDQNTVVRTSRGLSIAGTRITLYTIMDHLKLDWPAHLIRDWFNLTDQQMQDVLDYIEAHRAAVEAEYQQVLKEAEEIERYWRERNREHLAKVAAMPPKPGQEEIWARLQAAKKRLGMDGHDSD